MQKAIATDRRGFIRAGFLATVIGGSFLAEPVLAQAALSSSFQESASPSFISEFKLDLTPVSSLRAPAPKMRGSDLRRTRIDAILDQKNARFIGNINQDTLHQEIDIASLTKMATYFMTEKCLAQSTDFLGRPFTLGTPLRDGVPLEEHMFRMMRRSNNYSAQLIAIQMCGSVPAYVERVNFEMRQLGMRNTCLLNPSGLPGDQDWDGRASDSAHRGYSTVYDQGVLVAQIYAHGYNYERYTSLDAETNLPSTNPLFHGDENIAFSRENGVNGLKTGTSNKGTHFIGSQKHNDRVISPITLGHVWSRIGDYRNAEERREDRGSVSIRLIREGQSLLDFESAQLERLRSLEIRPVIPITDIPPVTLPDLSV